MEERQLIFDYARDDIWTALMPGSNVHVGMRGELAGKVFVALQNILDVVEQSEKVNEVGSPCVSTERLREEIRRAFA